MFSHTRAGRQHSTTGLLVSRFVVAAALLFALHLFSADGQTASKRLLLDFSFDDASDRLMPYSGLCPLPAYFMTVATTGTPTYPASRANFGSAVRINPSGTDTGYINTGTWAIASPFNAYTLAAWVNIDSSWVAGVRQWPFLAQDNGAWELQVNKANPTFLLVVFDRLGNKIKVESGNMNLATWYHVVASVNDAGKVRLYVNGVRVDQEDLSGQLPADNSYPVVIGSRYFIGLLDEVRVYNYALTASEVSTLFNLAAASVPPQISMPGPQVIPLDTALTLSPNVTATGTVTYSWSLGCGQGTFSSPNALSTDVTIRGQVFQTYVVQLIAADSELCSLGTTSVTLDATPPDLDITRSNFPSDGVLDVPLGGSATISLVLSGQPPPAVTWQEYVDITNRRELVFRHACDDDEELMTLRAAAILQACNASLNFTTQCAAWQDIANQTSYTYTSPVGDEFLNNTLIRFVASNSKGTYVSSSVLLAVGTTPVTTAGTGDGGDGVNVGAIVGPIVGVLALCCCLFLLVLVALIIVLLRRKAIGNNDFPGIPPDYDRVIYGPYLDPMYKVKSKHESALERLEELLTTGAKEHFPLATALANACPNEFEDALARDFTYLFHDHGQCMSVLQLFVEQALERNDSEGTLFRSNGMESRMFRNYAVLVGIQYLWQLLAEYVWEIQKGAREIDELEEIDEEMGSSSGSSSSKKSSAGSSARRLLPVGMEIDPMRLDDAADPKVNTLQLWLTAQKIFSSFTRSTPQMPKQLADLLIFVHDVVNEKFPGEQYKAMGGFLFLRFVCPSLLAPHLFGLLEDPPTPTAQRQLILVGKVLQNLSNDTLPGIKEEYMTKLNEFITTNQEDLKSFFDSVLEATDLQTVNPEVPDVVLKNSIADVLNIMIQCKPRVYKWLEQMYGQGHPIFGELDRIMEVGPLEKECEE